MFGKGTPWTRGYLRREVEAWNASGGVSSNDSKLALDEEVVTLRANMNVEERFEVTEVFVVRPEQGLESGLWNRDLPQRSRLDSRIPLYFSYLAAPKGGS